MAEFSVIKESEAPRPARQNPGLAVRMREYEAFVRDVAPGKVGRLTPSAGESVRAVNLRISRAGTRIGKPVNTWIADGSVFFSPR